MYAYPQEIVGLLKRSDSQDRLLRASHYVILSFKHKTIINSYAFKGVSPLANIRSYKMELGIFLPNSEFNYSHFDIHAYTIHTS